MMLLRRRALLALLLAAAACRSGDTAPARRTLIDSRDRYDPRTLDPARATDVPSGRAVAYLFDGLTRFAPDGSLQPALATRWDVSSDGREYVFHLRSGVRFHDGRPFTARNVASTFARVLDPKEGGTRGWPLFPIAGARDFAAGRAPAIRGVRVENDTTVRLTLDSALAIFPKFLAMPIAAIVPDSVPADFSEHPIGTGPWRFVSWRHDDHLLFAKNPEYFDGPPKADSLMARVIAEPSTAVAEFETGNVDLLYVPEAETAQWERTDERKALLVSAPALRLWYVAINTTRGPLRDVRVRQAINHAVDVPTILRALLGGRGTQAAGVIPPSLDGADTARAPYAHDVARARQLLADAGYPNGIDLELWHAQDPTFARVAQSIQAYLAEAGIRAKLVQRDANAARAASRNGETDLYLKDWYADYPDAENFLYPLLHSDNRGAGGNVSFYANARYDSLVNAARRELDDARRVALYRQADSLAFADAPMVYLVFYNELYAVQPWIKGFAVPVIFNGQRWTDVTIEP
jgi:peptide/nickel transport system substrate-binding protein/oligopeptide transport system substrate-binding protein